MITTSVPKLLITVLSLAVAFLLSPKLIALLPPLALCELVRGCLMLSFLW